MLYPITQKLDRFLIVEGLDCNLRLVLANRIATLSDELMAHTEFIVVERGDTAEDVVRETGTNPLHEPYDALCFDQPGFEPHWDWLVGHEGWFEVCFSFGSSFAVLLYVPDYDGIIPDLRAMCRVYASKA